MSDRMIEALELVKHLIDYGASEDEALKAAEEQLDLTHSQLVALRSHLEPWA